MDNDITLKTFPSNETEAIAYLYIQSQDLTGKTPAEIFTMYYDAYYEITKDRRLKSSSGWFKAKQEGARIV